MANFPDGFDLPKITSAKISPVTTPNCERIKILETSLTGDKSTTPHVFRTKINLLNFLFKDKISRTYESVNNKSPLTGFLSEPSPESLPIT